MSNTTLYTIKNEYLELENELELCEGELTPELIERLTINESTRNEKTEAYIGLIKSREATITMRKDEIKRLTALNKTDENLIDRLKGSLYEAVTLFGAYTTTLFKVGTRKSTVLVLADEELISTDWQKIAYSWDKAGMKDALKNGQEVPGVELVTNYSLSIK